MESQMNNNQVQPTDYSIRTALVAEPQFSLDGHCRVEKGTNILKAQVWHKLQLYPQEVEGGVILFLSRPNSICKLPIQGEKPAFFESDTDNRMISWPFRVRATNRVAVQPLDFQGSKGILVELKGVKEIDILFTRATSTVTEQEKLRNFTLRQVNDWQLDIRDAALVDVTLANPVPIHVVNHMRKKAPSITISRGPNCYLPEALCSKLRQLTKGQLQVIDFLSLALMNTNQSPTGSTSTDSDSSGDLFN